MRLNDRAVFVNSKAQRASSVSALYVWRGEKSGCHRYVHAKLCPSPLALNVPLTLLGGFSGRLFYHVSLTSQWPLIWSWLGGRRRRASTKLCCRRMTASRQWQPNLSLPLTRREGLALNKTAFVQGHIYAYCPLYTWHTSHLGHAINSSFVARMPRAHRIPETTSGPREAEPRAYAHHAHRRLSQAAA